jgi:hypothetical protein
MKHCDTATNSVKASANTWDKAGGLMTALDPREPPLHGQGDKMALTLEMTLSPTKSGLLLCLIYNQECVNKK